MARKSMVLDMDLRKATDVELRGKILEVFDVYRNLEKGYIPKSDLLKAYGEMLIAIRYLVGDTGYDSNGEI